MKEFDRLKDNTRWVAPGFVFNPGARPEPRRAPVWRQVGLAVAGGVAVAAVLIVGVTVARSTHLTVADTGLGSQLQFTQTPGLPAGITDEAHDGPLAFWHDDGKSIDIVLWGSTSCPAVPRSLSTDVTVDPPTIRIGFAANAAEECTADLSPTTTNVSTPDGVDSRDAAWLIIDLPGGDAATVPIEPVIRWEELQSDTPGAPVTTVLGEPLSHDGAGTQSFDLGDRPEGANAVVIEFWCRSEGPVTFGDNGGGITCDTASLSDELADAPDLTLTPVDVPADQTDYRITAHDDASWTARTTWVETHLSAWGVNANGQTFGQTNANGDPDLMSTYATNGRLGYTFSKEHDSPGPCDMNDAATYSTCLDEHKDDRIAINVYESDGVTIVGEFVFG